MTPAAQNPATRFPGVRTFVRRTVLAFAAISLMLSLTALPGGDAAPLLSIRAGVLDDLVRELPRGRQGLVSSLWCMPLPALAGLLFVPLAGPGGAAAAHLFGMALLVSLAVSPLTDRLRRLRLPAAGAVSLALLAAPTVLLAPTAWADLPTCLSFLVLALTLDASPLPVLRALSGTFHGLAFLCHPLGGVVALARLAWCAAAGLWPRANPEFRAINGIRAAQILYAAAVYFFMSWMIMGNALYPLRHTAMRLPAGPSPRALRALAERLTDDYPDFAPVASGLWGYTVADTLAGRSGHHFLDFHAGRIPPWERRDILLVIPTAANPLSALSDLAPETGAGHRAVGTALRIGSTADWTFLQIARTPPAPPAARGQDSP